MKTLVDASSILILLKHLQPEELARLADQLGILDLTPYEVGNALWKNVRLLKTMSREEAEVVHGSFLKLLPHLTMIRVDSLRHQEILESALSRGSTYYDMSYLSAAETFKVPLATEDKKLGKMMNSKIKTVSWRDVVHERES